MLQPEKLSNACAPMQHWRRGDERLLNNETLRTEKIENADRTNFEYPQSPVGQHGRIGLSLRPSMGNKSHEATNYVVKSPRMETICMAITTQPPVQFPQLTCL